MTTFPRRRIRGISFRHTRPGNPQANRKFRPDLVPLVTLSTHEMARAKPKPFDKSDIHRLLCDLGRQELHTLVTDCIEHVAHWRQITSRLRPIVEEVREFAEAVHLTFSENATLPQRTDWILAYLEAQAVYRLWRHRLTMLEMIADAQSSWQHEYLLKKTKK